MAVSPLSLIRGVKYTAIDFGHSSIKYLSCRVKNNKFKLIASGRREIPSGTIQDGRVNDIHLLTKIIADIFNENNLKSGVLMFTPASGQEFVRTITLPKMPDDEIEDALIWEVQDFLDLPTEKIALDYVVLNESEDEYELLVTVISKDVLNEYLEAFENNLLKVKVVNLEDLALISLMSKNNDLDQPTLILDTGASSSKLLIAEENKFYLSREVNTSGNDFTDLFLKEDGSHEEAESAKKIFEFEPEMADEAESNLDLMLSDIETSEEKQEQVKNLADDIIYEINRSIEYHNERNTDNPVTKVYLTGGGLLLNGLVPYIKDQIDTAEISVISPLKNCSSDDNFDQNIKGFMGVAAGTIISEVMNNES